MIKLSRKSRTGSGDLRLECDAVGPVRKTGFGRGARMRSFEDNFTSPNPETRTRNGAQWDEARGEIKSKRLYQVLVRV